MKTNAYFTVLFLFFTQTVLLGQGFRAYINGSYYNDNDDVYIACTSGGFNVQIQYNYNGNWYAATHESVNTAPSGWNWTFQPTNNYNKTSINFAQNYPTSSGQLVIQWSAALVYGSTDFHLNMRATPQLYFTSTPNISSSYSSNTYSVYAATTGNVNWTSYGGIQVNGSNYSSSIAQSATVSTQAYGGKLEVTATNACGTSPALTAYIYTPYIQNTTVNGSPGSSATVPWVATLSLLTNGTASNANWSVTNGSGSISPSGTSCNAYPSNFLRVVGAPINSAGTGPEATFYIFKEGYSPYRMAYPNPAKDQVTLDFEDAQLAQELVSTVSLVDRNGKSWRDFNGQ